jgi:hypothetical protein
MQEITAIFGGRATSQIVLLQQNKYKTDVTPLHSQNCAKSGVTWVLHRRYL